MSNLVGHRANFAQRLEIFVGSLQDGLPMPSAISMTAGMENDFAEPGSPRIFFGINKDQYWIGSIGQVSVLAFGDFVGPELSRTRPDRVKRRTRPVQDVFNNCEESPGEISRTKLESEWRYLQEVTGTRDVRIESGCETR